MREVLEWALVHDGPEAATGDIQHPVKEWIWSNKGTTIIKEMEDDLCPWVKEYHTIPCVAREIVFVADRLEMADFLRPYIGREDVKRMRDGLILHIRIAVELYHNECWDNAVGQILADFLDERTPWMRMQDRQSSSSPPSSPETGLSP
jgi:hypothetical protein